MNRKLIPLIIANLFAAGAALAQEAAPAGTETPPAGKSNFVWSGEVSAGGIGVKADVDNRSTLSGPLTRDGAKLNEYRDLKNNSATGSFDVRGRSDRFYVNAFGENLNHDDQYLNFQGGMYDTFKFRLFDDRMVHNLSWQLLTPFSGVGSAALTSIPGSDGFSPGSPDTQVGNWNMYDASLKKQNIGGYLEYSKNSPWYFRLDANQMTTKGIQAASAPIVFGTSAQIDLPMPINYKTQNYSLETGFSNKRGLINANFSQSYFSNANEWYTWQDPRFSNGTTNTMEAAPSVQSKFAVNGTLRQLPLNSTLTSRISYSQLTNSIALAGPYITNLTAAGPTYTTATPSTDRYEGKIVTSVGSLAMTSNPLKNLDTKVYYNWYHMDNQSTFITYSGGGSAPGSEGYNYGKFGFKKNNYGVDTGLRVNADNKISLGASQQVVDRSPMPARPLNQPATTIDNTYYAEYKNSTFDVITPRARYERATRSSGNWFFGRTGQATAVDPAYTRPMDTANYHQDRVKLAFDANPAPLLDISMQGIYKMTNYDASTYGLRNDRRQEVDLTLSYGDANVFRATLFADYEMVTYQDDWYVGALGVANPSAANFNLQTKARNSNKMLGLAADWPMTEKFKMIASYMYMRTTGTVDFLQNSTGSSNSLFTQVGPYAGGIQPYTTDNATKQTVNLTGKYAVNKNWSLTGAYTYEKYSIRDDQMYAFGGGYAYVMNLGSPNLSFFSGAFQNPSYAAQFVRLMATYKF